MSVPGLMCGWMVAGLDCGNEISILTSQAEFQTIYAAYYIDIDTQIYQFLSCM